MKPKFAFRSILLASSILMAQYAQAANYYWDTDGTTSGLGNTAGIWGTNTFFLTIPAGILNGTAATTVSATANTDAAYFGTNNLALGAAASTIGIAGGGVTINTIVFGTGQGAQGVTLSGGGGTITLGGTAPSNPPTITANNTGINTIGAVLAGTVGLVKSGSGTVVLTGANSFTGGLTINGGGMLQVGNGTTGSLTSQALTFNNGGGIINFQEAAGSAQAIGALTLSTTGAGDSTVQSTYGGSGNTSLTFASFAARGAGTTGNFVVSGGSNGTSNKIVFTSTTNVPLASTSNNQGLFFGGTEFARYDAGGFIRATNYGTDTNASALVSGATIGTTTSATDIKLNGDITAQTTASANTINLAASNFTFQNTASTLSVNGILSAGSASASIANGTNASSIQTTASGGELVIRVNGSGDALTIAPNIVANGASSLTKSGAGTLTLAGTNTYTGTTTVSGGTLALSGGAAIVDTGAVALANASGATLLLNNNETIGQLSGGGFSGGNVNVGANTLTIANANSQTFGGTLTGSGGLTISSGTLTLSNKNTFAGAISLLGNSQLTLSYGSDGVANSTTVSSGGTITMSGSSSLLVSPGAQVAGGVAVGAQNAPTGGTVVSNDFVVSSGIGTIKAGPLGGGGDSKYVFTGGVTGGTSGAQTLAIATGGTAGNGERISIQFTGVIQDGAGGTMGVNADYQSISGLPQDDYINLNAQNTFTGPINVNNGRCLTYVYGTSGGHFVIGGDITKIAFGARTVTAGTGVLGWNGSSGNYSNTISLAGGTVLDFLSNTDQTLGGVISGAGNLAKEAGTGTLTLSAANTFTGSTAIASGILSLTNVNALQNSVYDTTNSTTGGAAVGLRTNQTSLNLGGLSGNKNLAAIFTTTSGGYSGVTDLTLNTLAFNNPTYSAVIANGAAGMNLSKTGAGTQILSGANTYTGTTAINGGTLQLGAGSTTGTLNTGSAISVASGATFAVNRTNTVTQGTDFSGAAITGAGGFTQMGTGTTVLNATNSYQGPTTISAGTVSVGSSGNLGSGGNIVFNGGTLQITGTSYTSITGGGHAFVVNPAQVVRLDINNAGNSFTYDQALPSNGLALSGAGTVAFQSSVSAVTLNSPSGNLTYGGIIADGSGARSITKTGAGTQILTGASTYTGTTTINQGTLTIGNGTTGSLNGTTGTALTFGGTSIFNVAEAAASTQGMGALSFNAGDGTVRSTFAATSANLTLSAPSRTAGATGVFIVSGGAMGTANTNANGALGTNNIILTGQTGQIPMGVGYFAGTASGSGYAFYDGAGFVRPIDYVADAIPASAATYAGAQTSLTSAGYVQLQSGGSVSAQANGTSFTGLHIVNTANSAQAFTLAGGATVTVNGILRSGNGGASSTTTISGGTGLTPTSNAEIVIRTDLANDLLSITTPILANGTNSLTKSGAGTLTLNANNTFTGGVTINGGTLAMTTAASFGGASKNVTFSGPGTLSAGAAYTGGAITINAGAIGTFTTSAASSAQTYISASGAGSLVYQNNNNNLLNIGNASGLTGDLQLK